MAAKPHKTRHHGSPRGGPQGANHGDRVLIYGIHSVEAALGNEARQVRALHLTENAERRLHGIITRRGLPHTPVHPQDLDRRLGKDTVHQGALLETQALPEPDLQDLAEAAGEGPLIVLDQVTDPHNVGAVLRSAAVFGAAGLIMTRRHSPPLDGTLAKSASGALEHVPIALVANLSRALADLKEQGVTVVGLDGNAPDCLEQQPWPERAALVLGAEGKGLRHLTRETCDRLCRITTVGALASLNVSNAAAIALHYAALARLKR